MDSWVFYSGVQGDEHVILTMIRGRRKHIKKSSLTLKDELLFKSNHIIGLSDLDFAVDHPVDPPGVQVTCCVDHWWGRLILLVLVVRVALSFTLWRHFCNDLKCCWSRVTSYNEQESSLWTRLDWMDRTNKTFIQVTALHVHVTPKVVTPTLRYVPGLRELFLTKQFLCWNLKKLRLFECFSERWRDTNNGTRYNGGAGLFQTFWMTLDPTDQILTVKSFHAVCDTQKSCGAAVGHVSFKAGLRSYRS